METLGAAASAFAVVSIADQVAERIKQLYEFWSAVNEAPEKIRAIANDLNLLSSVIVQISNNYQNVAQDKTSSFDSLMVDVLKACTVQVSTLVKIIDGFEKGFASSYQRVRKWSAVKAVFNDEKIKAFRTELDYLKSTLQLVCQQSLDRSTQSHFENQQRSIVSLNTAISALQIPQSASISEVSQADKDACISSFYLSDYTTKLIEVAKRAPGTCEWVLAHKNFQDWSESQSSALLWLSGHPGCGKTVISSFLIESLRARPNTTVIYFICDNKHEHFRTKECILRSLLHQLLRAYPEFLKYALPHFQTMKGAMATSAATLWTIFQDSIMDESLPQVFCILDALDECEDGSRQWLLERLSTVFPSNKGATVSAITIGPLKVLVTSRPWEDIEYGFQAASRIRLKTEEEKSINSDIHVFVEEQVKVLAKRRGYNDQQRAFVTETLVEKANGMFLWVSLVITDLEKTPPSHIGRRLNELPKTLFGFYQGILAKIDEFAIERIKRILQCVITAFRPLSLEELAIACEIHQIHQISEVNMDNLLQCIKGDIGLCGPILTTRNEHVSLVHQSAKDFFLAERRQLERSPTYVDYHIKPMESNADLTALCIKYLTFDEFDIQPLPSTGNYEGNIEPILSLLEKFPFLEYSAEYWPYHYQSSGNGIESLTEAIRNFFHLSQNSAIWFQIAFFLERQFRYTSGGTPLDFAIYLGIPSILQILLEEGINVNACDDDGQTPLHRFIYWSLSRQWSSDRKTILQALLAAGADVNSQDVFGNTPLHLATAFQETQFAKAVIGAGAEVTGQNRYEQTPLHFATRRGDRDIVRLLVEKGANVNAINRYGVTALMKASRYGYQEVVQFLVEKGASLTAKANGGNTALREAIWHENEGIVQILVEKGADINAVDEFGKTALGWAKHYGQTSVVQFLEELKDMSRLGQKTPMLEDTQNEAQID